MEHENPRPEDLVSLAAEAREREEKAREEKRQKDLSEARGVLSSALSPERWAALGLDPGAAALGGPHVRALGTFEYVGEEWTCAAWAAAPR